MKLVTSSFRRRRRVAALCVAGVLASLLPAAAAGAASLPAQYLAPTSFPNQLVNTPGFQLAPNSSVLVNGINQLVNGIPGIATGHGTYAADDHYAYPIYVVDTTIPSGQPGYTPRVPVAITKSPTAAFHASLQKLINTLGGVPIPSYAQPAMGTDGILDVYDSGTDTFYEFWHFCPKNPATVDPANGTFSIMAACQARSGQAAQIGIKATAETGGIVKNVSTSNGYFNSKSYPGYSFWSWGTLASNINNLAGEATITELQNHQINHAIAVSLPPASGGLTDALGTILYHGTLCTSKWTFPAQQRGPTYTPNSASDCIPEGTRMRLNLTDTQIAALNISPMARTYAYAAAHYGVILRERSATAPAVLRESPYPAFWKACPTGTCTSGTPINPYTGRAFGDKSTPTATSILAGYTVSTVMKGFPWANMQVQKPVTCAIPQAACSPVSLTAPLSGATVTGTTTLTAAREPNTSATLAGVTFQVDGVKIGAEDTTAPYSISWNTTTVTKGKHTLSTVTRDPSGLLSSSPPVSITVS